MSYMMRQTKEGRVNKVVIIHQMERGGLKINKKASYLNSV